MLPLSAATAMPSALALLNQILDDLVPATPAAVAKPEAAKPTAAKPEIAKVKAAAAPQAQNAAKKKAEAPAAAPATPSASATTSSGSAGSELPSTQALYQTDTYLFTCEATVLAILPPADSAKDGWAVVLDSTCFHPQGGGQPADTGSIGDFTVAMVKKDPRGVVRHEGPTEPNFSVGAKVTCTVDEAGRVKNSRVHSAGHLIDVAMTNAGMADKLRPTKGYHFTPGAYVEYDGKLDAAEREALLPKLQAQMDELIAQRIETKVQTIDAQALDTLCPPNALPSDRSLWGSGWVRVVCVGGLGCPCGGTHVRDTQELGQVKVEGVKVKGKVRMPHRLHALLHDPTHVHSQLSSTPNVQVQLTRPGCSIRVVPARLHPGYSCELHGAVRPYAPAEKKAGTRMRLHATSVARRTRAVSWPVERRRGRATPAAPRRVARGHV